jgi:hypothetical protein
VLFPIADFVFDLELELLNFYLLPLRYPDHLFAKPKTKNQIGNRHSEIGNAFTRLSARPMDQPSLRGVLGLNRLKEQPESDTSLQHQT